jgi:hypothetical protein
MCASDQVAMLLASGRSVSPPRSSRIARAKLLRPGDLEQSVRDADAAVELCTAAGDLEGRCMALEMVAAHAAYVGDADRAQAAAMTFGDVIELVLEPPVAVARARS